MAFLRKGKRSGDDLTAGGADESMAASEGLVRVIPLPPPGATDVPAVGIEAPVAASPVEIPVFDVFGAWAAPEPTRFGRVAEGTSDEDDATAGDSDTDTKVRQVIVIDSENPVDRSTAGSGDGTDASTAIDPRIRARRRTVRREAGRKRLRVLIAAGSVVMVCALVVIVVATPLFAARNIEVSGHVYADPARVNQAIAVLDGRPMARLDLDAARAELAADPWVRSVTVQRDWPSSVRIDMAERQPIVAFPSSAELWHIADTEGLVVATIENQPAELTIIVGDPTPTPIGEKISPQMADGVRLARALPKRLKERIQQIRVGALSELQLELTDSSIVYFGTIADMRDKLVSILTVIDRCGGQGFETLNVAAPRDLVITPIGACKPQSLTGTPP